MCAVLFLIGDSTPHKRHRQNKICLLLLCIVAPFSPNWFTYPLHASNDSQNPTLFPSYYDPLISISHTNPSDISSSPSMNSTRLTHPFLPLKNLPLLSGKHSTWSEQHKTENRPCKQTERRAAAEGEYGRSARGELDEFEVVGILAWLVSAASERCWPRPARSITLSYLAETLALHGP